MAPFEFQTTGRRSKTVAALIVVYGVLVTLIIMFQASVILMAVLGLATLPALWDLWSNRRAGLCLDDADLSWHAGRLTNSVAIDQIKLVRFDARWDFSQRVSIVLMDNKAIRLPYEALPPHKEFEAQLRARNIATQRNPFSIL
jgi:hypothetical protein